MSSALDTMQDTWRRWQVASAHAQRSVETLKPDRAARSYQQVGLDGLNWSWRSLHRLDYEHFKHIHPVSFFRQNLLATMRDRK